MIFFLLLISSVCFSERDDSLPPPYNTVEILPPYTFEHWFVNQKQLRTLISEHNVSEIVELGSWLGASAIWMAREVGPSGKIYCVDHWKGSVEHHRPNRKNIRRLLPRLYQQFLSNVIHAGLTDVIVPVKMSTALAAQKLEVIPDLVYVDAAHDEISVFRDITQWYAKLPSGGIMCGDDWPREGVNRAVRRFAKKHGIRFHSSGNFWSFPPK